MAELFEVNENDLNDSVFKKYPNLNITENKSRPSYYIILRGLVGNLEIKQNFRNETFFQNIDYLDTKYSNLIYSEEHNYDEFEKKEIENELKIEIGNLIQQLKYKSNLIKLEKYFGEDFTLEDLSILLKDKQLTFRNKFFFDNLNNEFLNFHYNTFKSNHTIAFLHLYRILEYTSYTFPLLYAVSTKDFSNSFESLKVLFSGEKDKGELKVYKDFINEIFGKSKYYGRITIDIDIISDLPEYNERIYKTLLKICDSDIFDLDKNSENSKVAIRFTEFSSFIITVRNRFFHLKNSQSNNIHSIDIVDSEHFFKLINRKCAYFISLITFEIIQKSCLVKLK
jgi:hypothetical protein